MTNKLSKFERARLLDKAIALTDRALKLLMRARKGHIADTASIEKAA